MACRQPKSKSPAHDSNDGRSPGERLVAAYEFAAAEYGWTPQTLEEELSDEQLVAYLDAASDRIGARHAGDFDASVEAVRVGTIIAHNKKAADKWRRAASSHASKKQRGLTGAALEAAVMQIAAEFPNNVVSA